MQYILRLITLIGCVLLAACSTIDSQPLIAPIHPAAWGIAPFANNTEVPQAGSRATAITANLLRSKGVFDVHVYPLTPSCNQLIICPNQPVSIVRIHNWAMQNHLTYVMLGSVNEWEYKVGLDGEPVAAVALQLYDADSDTIIWSAVGSKIGWSRSGLGNVGQQLINDMLNHLFGH